MPFARTVLGDIDTNSLGKVYSHEHLIISGGIAVADNPGLRLDSVEKACEELDDIAALGISTVVDMMPVDCGREPEALVRIAKESGMNVIACTGFHKPMYYDDLHWFYRYDEDTIADLFAAEIDTGMDAYSYAGPVIRRLDAKAGVIKAASDYHRMASVTQKLFRAAAAAHIRTNAPISTHTEHGTFALEQIRMLTDLGVAAERIIICHLDRNPDLGYHKEVASTGVYIEYDNASRIKYWPDSTIADIIARMAAEGFAEKILLGTDFALRSYWSAYGGGPGMKYLMGTFVPKLKAFGIDDSTIDKFFISNPARAFAMGE